MESIKIGILGMGNIGTGLYKILQINDKKIKNYANKKIEVKKVLVKNFEKQRDVDIPKELLTLDVDEIIYDPEIKIIVELIGGINPAYDYLKRSIENGKHVVTANKAVIATFGKELDDLAVKHGVQIKFEGSVGGGIPIINTLTESLSANEIEEIVGIINGTTNYILTQMSEFGMEFETALKEAQIKGFAEADPISDLEGEDAVFKLAILSAVAFNKRVYPDEISREGIKKISQKDIKYASELGYKIKLLATAKKYGNNLELNVHPALIPNKHPLASVNNEFNALFIRGNAVGEVMLYGKGAGSMPTGSAVLGDVLSIIKAIEADGIKNSNNNITSKLVVNNIGQSKYYVRLEVVDEPGVLGKIAINFGKYGVSLESVVQRARGEKTVPLVFITHETDREKLDKALEEISSFSVVDKIASILKVEE
ncbi:homoserine dehydrogenase [Caminicella sporogenes]|uniref:homoserine dehydrogenase n=1 Tax=Caminicella sporogenes TaxID=166485 RepID=UPI002540FB73|nr:homoserine dehydrogenase [Caminicella sporogenes]WIF93960.1 homoserine dehydrogenase [Caminicella sporogenes]